MVLEPLPELSEVRRAIQPKLHTVINEAVVGFIRVLCSRFDVKDVVTAKSNFGVLVKAIRKR